MTPPSLLSKYFNIQHLFQYQRETAGHLQLAGDIYPNGRENLLYHARMSQSLYLTLTSHDQRFFPKYDPMLALSLSHSLSLSITPSLLLPLYLCLFYILIRIDADSRITTCRP
ncbi:hypothetical protein J6590_072464 [Homalodisca vitripennis]|nr:hypothetical protein J6590_072464 [Homalodisca vitripennis]